MNNVRNNTTAKLTLSPLLSSSSYSCSVAPLSWSGLVVEPELVVRWEYMQDGTPVHHAHTFIVKGNLVSQSTSWDVFGRFEETRGTSPKFSW